MLLRYSETQPYQLRTLATAILPCGSSGTQRHTYLCWIAWFCPPNMFTVKVCRADGTGLPVATGGRIPCVLAKPHEQFLVKATLKVYQRVPSDHALVARLYLDGKFTAMQKVVHRSTTFEGVFEDTDTGGKKPCMPCTFPHPLRCLSCSSFCLRCLPVFTPGTCLHATSPDRHVLSSSAAVIVPFVAEPAPVHETGHVAGIVEPETDVGTVKVEFWIARLSRNQTPRKQEELLDQPEQPEQQHVFGKKFYTQASLKSGRGQPTHVADAGCGERSYWHMVCQVGTAVTYRLETEAVVNLRKNGTLAATVASPGWAPAAPAPAHHRAPAYIPLHHQDGPPAEPVAPRMGHLLNLWHRQARHLHLHLHTTRLSPCIQPFAPPGWAPAPLASPGWVAAGLLHLHTTPGMTHMPYAVCACRPAAAAAAGRLQHGCWRPQEEGGPGGSDRPLRRQEGKGGASGRH